ncbi:MAG TPA: hypothetical protein VHE80_05645, partial [Acidimicrobiales bacterium]|nr:hypothetical protein [Acidimicrobiales bacterium]
IFCIAVFVALAGQVTSAVVDQIAARLEEKASGPVRKTSDTESVAKLEFEIEAGGKEVPVATTVFKQSRRVRIQLMDHELSREEAEKLQNLLADLLDLRVVERSDPGSEAKVRQAHDAALREATSAAAPQRQRSRWPFRRSG